MDVKELVQHMKSANSINTIVIGPYIGDYQLLTEEEQKLYTFKNLIKNTASFYDVHFKKMCYPINSFISLLSALQTHVKMDYLFAQTTNGSLQDKLVTYLKGNSGDFKCVVCQKKYILDTLPKDYVCTCGKKIRPLHLLPNEVYDIDQINQFEEALKQSDTIFLIGFDFNELELCKQLEVIAAHKTLNQKGPVVVVVGECDKKAVFETFKCDFIVDEPVESAIERLLTYF